jgi:hypothetical protein
MTIDLFESVPRAEVACDTKAAQTAARPFTVEQPGAANGAASGHGPLQLAREEQAELERRRAAAGYDPIMEERRPIPETEERNCAGCEHLGDFNDEHKRGYCLWLKRMRSTWHPVICKAFTPKTRERRTKHTWQGVAYG